MSIIRKKIKSIIIFVLITLFGIYFLKKSIYPRIVYDLNNLDSWYSPIEAFEKSEEATSEINIFFEITGNNFKTDMYPVFLTKKNYSRLYVKKISYIYEGNEYVVQTDAYYDLCSDIRKMDENKRGWITNGTYYWMNGLSAELQSKKNRTSAWPRTNFRKIFKHRKIGERFPFTVLLIYQFDDEEEKVAEIKYMVVPVKNEYISPFYF